MSTVTAYPEDPLSVKEIGLSGRFGFAPQVAEKYAGKDICEFRLVK